MELASYAIVAVIAFLVGNFFRPFLSGYATKKGENLATHEDINKILDQVRAVTETTKNIEAEISTGVWNKQKRWEMKREILFEAARKISEIDDNMLSLSIMLKNDCEKQKEWAGQSPSMEDMLSWGEIKTDTLKRWSKASSEFDVSRSFVRIICTKEAIQAFNDLGTSINSLGAQLTKDPNAYDVGKQDLFKKILMAQKAIRKELEVDS